MKNYPEIGKNFIEGSKKLGAQEPETMKAFGALIKATTLKEGALSPKIKELIALALGIAARCDGCIAHHTHECIKAGVTREELVEMIGVCQLMGGGPSTVYGAEALMAYDQFMAEKS
ncbi:carboxymuconolactone decarboxylase family protein [Roseofilum sp. BLCC_M154]|uniref:Carboxymuconolactone decarboxylase family protein n=1 Tax=Roseofilum acuticapitatum BLCC-M154 TaxID=3022444 RepID=A0ABT7AQH2_9CYAN|nr:carboxymuconolactone decarboxylase family protein [Roseofilum acuticapitatum]MDJ1169152.1 carboxymuconolactone decarboxylase family protein [Roseofilum acuticapitatum BLCC-M154]